MAQLPTAEALGETPVPVLPRRTPMLAYYRPTTGLEDFGAQEMNRSAGELEAASQVALRAKEQQDNLRAEDALNQLRAKETDLTFGQSGFANLKGSAAVNQPVLKNYGAQFDQAAAALAGGLDNDYQRTLFAQRAQIAGLGFRQNIVKHVAQQSDVYAENVFKGTLSTELNSATADPSQTPMALTRSAAAIKQYADRFGMPDDWAQSTMAAQKSAIYSSQIKTLLANSPEVAQQYYDAHMSDLSPAERPVLEHAVKQAMYPRDARNTANSVMQEVGFGPNFDPTTATSIDVRARLGDVVDRARADAEKLHPGDPVFSDMVVQEIKGRIGTMAAIYEGSQRMAYQTLSDKALGINRAGGQPGPRATTMDDLLNTPEARAAWQKVDPNGQRGIIALLNQNARQASGEFLHGNPGLYEKVRSRIYLPEGDPNKITSPTQIFPYFSHGDYGEGLNYTQGERLKKELQDFNTPEGNPFLKQVNTVKSTASRMLTQSLTGATIAHPELAQEAAYRFGVSLDQQIKEARQKGGEQAVQALFQPGSPTYVLDPNRVQSFMPTQSEIKAREAAGLQKSAPPPKISNDADYNALKPGTVYIAPDGSTRRKQ